MRAAVALKWRGVCDQHIFQPTATWAAAETCRSLTLVHKVTEDNLSERERVRALRSIYLSKILAFVPPIAARLSLNEKL